ncbi:MAG TPA: hypothetical protein VLA10_06740 [Ilumatobacter sp.]|nr:hypothetical protein [Ilumatobacter sp.]
MSITTRPIHLIEFELECAIERRAIYARRPDDDMISRFQCDQNQREIDRLTDELELARSQP